jgi:hypothetical protein
VIGQDEQHIEVALGGRRGDRCALDLLACGHQRGAVLQREAVPLRIGELEAVDGERAREGDDFVDAVEVLPMKDAA